MVVEERPGWSISVNVFKGLEVTNITLPILYWSGICHVVSHIIARETGKCSLWFAWEQETL